MRYSTTFAEPEVYRLPTYSYHSVERSTSPAVPIMTAQDLVEPIMLEAARSYGRADVRFGAELVALGHDVDGCRATIRDVATGAETEVLADYVIGADGRHSTVPRLLGSDLDVGFTGSMEIQDVLYHADMSPWVGERIGALLFVYHPMGYGLFQPMDGRTRWRAQCTTFTPAIAPEDVTVDDCIAWIRSAIGDEREECRIEVESVAPWRPEARLADDFRRGRVFLAGDAAHTLFPTGGLGMNLGYHGVHNLCWKLAFVLGGHSQVDLLDTYEIERRPQAGRTRVASVENARLAGELYRAAVAGEGLAAAGHRLRQYGNFEGLVLGGEYQSGICAVERHEAPAVDNDLVDFVPTVRTGWRAPHARAGDGSGRSVLDHFGAEYVLLSSDRGSQAALQIEALRTSGFPARVELLPDAEPYDAAQQVLVRPDGIIAARLGPDGALDEALLGRVPSLPEDGRRGSVT